MEDWGDAGGQLRCDGVGGGVDRMAVSLLLGDLILSCNVDTIRKRKMSRSGLIPSSRMKGALLAFSLHPTFSVSPPFF